MYYPRREEYSVEDLILEKQLGAPILELAAGRFVAGSTELCLAVLHPNKLCVHMVSAVGGDDGAAGGQGTQGGRRGSSGGAAAAAQAASYYSIIECYSHDLKRPAFNLAYGPFSQAGGSYGGYSYTGFEQSLKDHMCVQSLDGVLSFFEQDAPAFKRM